MYDVSTYTGLLAPNKYKRLDDLDEALTYFSLTAAINNLVTDLQVSAAQAAQLCIMMDPIFILRMGAAAKQYGAIALKYGYRTIGYQDQKAPNNAFKWSPALLPSGGGDKIAQCKCWTGGNGRLAKPGTSFHNYGWAADVGGQLYYIDSSKLTPFGLQKNVPGEPWHVAPLETGGYKGFDRARVAVWHQGGPLPEAYALRRKGDKGMTVCQIQQTLIKLGYKPGKVDGIFGSGTEAAVKSFQAAKNLATDGVVGPKTYDALGLGLVL